MAQRYCQHTISTVSNGAWRNRRSQPPQGPTPVLPVFPQQIFRTPANQFSPYYISNLAPSSMLPTRGNNGNQHQITNLERSNVVWMQHGGYVQEDETWVIDGIGQEEEDAMILGDETWVIDGIGQEPEEDTMILGDGCLSEEVVSKCLKTRNWNHEVVGRDKDEEAQICVVCQDNLRQENQTIGVLHCGHEYHACCIKKWLLSKNICPLCKAPAIVSR